VEIVSVERSYVRVAGPDAADFLQRMLSNDAEGLRVGGSCAALLLTPKGRVIAPLVLWRRGEDDFLLVTEPELGDVVRAHLTRMRLRARCEIEAEQHRSTIVFGGGDGLVVPGLRAIEVLDAELEDTLSPGELERRRIEAGVPRWGREIDDRILPAEAGLTETHVSFTKGCYPGQEPIARLHYRGHPNRGLRVLAVKGAVAPDDELTYEGKVVGRVTSAADGLALAYVRVEVPAEAELRTSAATLSAPPRP
jgi:folate-binding protein YgfZ